MQTPLGPRRVTAHNGPWPLHNTASSRTLERAAQQTLPPHALMAQAGLAVAKLALAMAPDAARVQVFAGPGNNGGDGWVAARLLHQAGKQVLVSFVGDAARLPDDAVQAMAAALAAGVPVGVGAQAAPHDLAIDALLGIGSSRAPSGDLAAAIECMNRSSPLVLAVDLPSGLAADTGSMLGPSAVRADATLSLLTIKPGGFTAAGRDHAGAMWFDDLGVAPGPAHAAAWLSGPGAPLLRHHATHKGSYGDVVVVGGAPGMTGAAWLAAHAALAAGAGRVYCSLFDAQAALFNPNAPELMGRSAWWRSSPEVLRQSTVVCGCGGGDAVREPLPALLSHVPRLVLDADALNALAADTSLQTLLQQRSGRGLPTVLTPHPLEAARLLQTGTAQVQADRLQSAQTLANKFNLTVLLKGSGSVIAAPGEAPHINPTGNAALASAGTGDVLAGWLAGLWSQSPEQTPQAVSSAAAWWHGQAADAWQQEGHPGPLCASALVRRLGQRTL